MASIIGGYLRDLQNAQRALNEKGKMRPSKSQPYKKIKLLVPRQSVRAGEYTLLKTDRAENNFSVWASKDGELSLSVLDIYKAVMDNELEVLEEYRGT